MFCQAFSNKIIFSISGQAYYVNKYTKESQWEMPTHPAERGPDGEKVFVKYFVLRCFLKLLKVHSKEALDFIKFLFTTSLVVF
jgi:hypothetical protein